VTVLTRDFERTAIRKPEPLLKGLDARLHSAAGAAAAIGSEAWFLGQARRIDEAAGSWKDLSDGKLHAVLDDLRESFRRRHRGWERLLPEAFGAAREAAARRVGLRPYMVQIAGALALYHGHVVEMSTGEGKTLTAALAMVINGWSGRPCHVITVNDYLAERDASWMEALYRFCGVSVGHVTSVMDPPARRKGYAAGVTYTTSKEIVADFLRDRLWLGELQKAERRQIAGLLGRSSQIETGLVMRGIHTAIVDEADNILIDEAVTPLIISRACPNTLFVDACRTAHSIAGSLEPGRDYRVNRRRKEIEFDDPMKDRVADRIRARPGIFGGVAGNLELVHQALSAREFFRRDGEYVILDGKIVIVDEFTGRQMPQRQWRGGLHQLIELKEGLDATAPTETLARLSFQRFFRFFDRLAGMTGTAREAAPELWDIYQLAVVRIPENRPCIREQYPALAFADARSRWDAVVEEIAALHATGRPVLAGTRSVNASEHLSRLLSARGLAHTVLNAVRHREEAAIVARAGDRGAITIATNMAGRGTDIRLAEGVARLGGLHVIATECHESRRIDRQLFGRAARQGDPGSARSYVSMEDELMVRFVPGAVLRALRVPLARRARGSSWLARRAVDRAQRTAQRDAASRRKAVLRMDTWLEDSLSFAPRDVS
jgi:preprotein translocase subunit SecA